MKVLLISTGFMDIASSFKNAFESVGCQCYFCNTSEVYCSNKENVLERRSKVALDVFFQYKPDLVLDLLGANLSKNVVKKMSENSVLIKYMLDLVRNYRELEDVLPFYNFVYTYETCDLDYLKMIGCNNARILYATYDDEKYFPIGVKKDIDICFVGQMYTRGQRKRREILEKIIKKFPMLKVCFYGVYVRPYQIGRYLKWKLKDNGKYFKNRTIKYDKVNDVYNRSKICLNINSFQTYETWSSRLLEMMGSGSFVVSNTTRDVTNFLGDGLVTYSTYDELERIIADYLSNEIECKKIADKGVALARKYTIKHTVKELIETTNHYIAFKR